MPTMTGEEAGEAAVGEMATIARALNAARYNYDFVTSPTEFELRVSELVNPETRVAEIGSGTGRFVALCCQRDAAHLVAIEPRAEFLPKMLATSPVTAAAYRQGKFEFIPKSVPDCLDEFDSESLDLVFSHSSLHYLSRSRRLLVLRQLRRIIRPGGCFACAVRSIDCSWFHRGNLAPTTDGRWCCPDGISRTFFTVTGFVQEFQDAGFQVKPSDCMPRLVEQFGFAGEADVWLEIIAAVS